MRWEDERRRIEKKREAVKAAEEKLRARLKEAQRKARETERRVQERHENWHCRALAHHDRSSGYDGTHAYARQWLRSLPWIEYKAYLDAALAANDGKASAIELEMALVHLHFAEFDKKARRQLYLRDRAIYYEELEAWKAFDAANPSAGGWRNKPSTDRQWILIDLLVVGLDVERPAKLTRGEAHDWIESHGGNPRYSDQHPLGGEIE